MNLDSTRVASRIVSLADAANLWRTQLASLRSSCACPEKEDGIIDVAECTRDQETWPLLSGDVAVAYAQIRS